MLLTKARLPRQQPAGGDRGHLGYPQAAGLTYAIQLRNGPGEVRNGLVQAMGQHRARAGELQPPRHALEKRHTNLRLERLDPMTYRALGPMKLVRCRCEAQVAGRYGENI